MKATYATAVWTSIGSVSQWSSTGNKTCMNTCHYTQSGATGLSSGSHLKHIWSSYQNLACDSCHTGAGAWNTNHVNHAIEVRLAQNFGGSYSQGLSSAPRNGFGNCSSTYCHGGAVTKPVWGSSGSAACGSCHENNNSLAGQHSKHYATATQATNRLAANNSTTSTYIYNCGTCHYVER